MLQVTVIAVGNLKEAYWRDALSEYEKRLRAFCNFEMTVLKESKLPEAPTDGEIRGALDDEAKRILAAIPPRAYRIALCVEGKQYSSQELAKRLEIAANEHGQIALIIGSSHGIAPQVKSACDLRLSVSELTFPHQMMRVMLLEILYRCFNIQKGTKYHK